MSKFTNARENGANFRLRLLATASAIALLGSAYGACAADSDSDRPTLWIELGGQLDRLSDQQEQFAPSLLANVTQPGLLSALNVQQPPTYALDEEGKISFQPDQSDWVFSASIRYGRSQANKYRHHQTPNAVIPSAHFSFIYGGHNYHYDVPSKYPSGHVNFADATAAQSEKHIILDFQVGKDVGLGMLGGNGSSVVSAGVRIAQLNSKSSLNLHLEPDVQYPTMPISSFQDALSFDFTPIYFHDYAITVTASRNFHGAGPLVGWNASVPVAGNSGDGEVSVDWGANAAVLFGRQEVSEQQKTVTQTDEVRGFSPHGLKINGVQHGYFDLVTTVPHSRSVPHNRERSVTVPNVGGSIGLSYRIEDFKVAFGYRADFFFGAIDGGIDTRKEESRSFFGPYASVSVGVGD